MRARAWAGWCFGASLLTLPWIGVGVMRLLTGRDLGAGLQPSWVFLAAATAAAVAGGARLREPLPRPVAVLAIAAAVALAVSLLGLAIAPPPVATTTAALRWGKQVVQLAIMVAFLAWPALWVRGEARWRLVARWLVAGALLQAGYGLLQQVHWYHPGPLLPALERVFTSNPAILSGSEQLHLGDRLRDVPRLRGTACEPLYLGNYLLAVLPLVALTGWRRAARLAASVAFGLLLLLTWSRGAWLAGIVAAVLAVSMGGWPGRLRRPRIWVWAAAATVLAAGALWLGSEQLALPVERMAQSFSTRDWSNLTRFYSVQAAWRAFTLSPVVGVGWGQFGWHFPVLVDAAGLHSQFTWPVVNCFPLQILCETGILGFGVLAVSAALLGRAAWRNRADGPRRGRIVACAVATAGVWVQLLTFSQYNLPHIWVAPGLLLAALAEDRGEAAP